MINKMPAQRLEVGSEESSEDSQCIVADFTIAHVCSEKIC